MHVALFHFPLDIPVAGETQGPLVVHEEVRVARGMGTVTGTAPPVADRFVDPRPGGRLPLTRNHILVARDAEVVPGMGQQFGVLAAMGRVAGQAFSTREGRVNARLLELGMKCLVARQADVGWLVLEQSFVGRLVARVASDAVSGLEGVVRDVSFRKLAGAGVAGFALLPAPRPHQGLVL
jgi:hypothetical protein